MGSANNPWLSDTIGETLKQAPMPSGVSADNIPLDNTDLGFKGDPTNVSAASAGVGTVADRRYRTNGGAGIPIPFPTTGDRTNLGLRGKLRTAAFNAGEMYRENVKAPIAGIVHAADRLYRGDEATTPTYNDVANAGAVRVLPRTGVTPPSQTIAAMPIAAPVTGPHTAMPLEEADTIIGANALPRGIVPGRVAGLRPGEAAVFDPRTGVNRLIDTNPDVQQAPAWDQAGIDAAKNDPARRVGVPDNPDFGHNTPDKMGPDRIGTSHAERVIAAQGQNQIQLEREQARHALTLAKAGLSPAQIKHAMDADMEERKQRGEMEKTRQEGKDKVLAAKEMAGGHFEDDGQGGQIYVAGKVSRNGGTSSGEAKASKDQNDALNQRITDLKAEYDKLPQPSMFHSADENAKRQKAIDDSLALIKQTQAIYDTRIGMRGSDEQGNTGVNPPSSTVPAQPAGLPKRVNSQAEYDALPVGATYIDSTGQVKSKIPKSA